MSRVVRLHETGGPEVLRVERREVPVPGPGEILLRVRAIGLNRAEAMYRLGAYLEPTPLPTLIGYEASGVVEAVGDGVEGFAPGDAVSTIPAFSMSRYGVYGDHALVPVHAVARHPARLSWEEATSIWMQYLTAWGGLVEVGALRAGQTVIVTAASSSVGIAALQIARQVDATAIATTRSGDKAAALREAGADHVVATDHQDLAAEVARITAGRGAELAFDPIAGLHPALRPPDQRGDAVPADRGDAEAASRAGLHAVPGHQRPGVAGAGQGVRHRRAESGALRPVVARVFALDDVAEAHRFMESNAQTGKIVVVP